MPVPRPLFAALGAALLVVACNYGTEPVYPYVTRLVVVDLPDPVGIGDTVRIEVEPQTEDSAVIQGVRLGYRSLHPAIATVDSTGLLTALDSGDATIVVTARARGQVESRFPVRVRPLPREVQLSLTGADSMAVAPGASTPVRAAVFDGAGAPFEGAVVTWSSSDTMVLVVDAQGAVRTRDEGSAWIRAAIGTDVDSVRVRGYYPRTTLVSTPLAQLSVGGSTVACGTTTAGVGQCWGAGTGPMFGSGGNGSAPIAGHAFRTVQVSYQHACGLRADSTAYCWGRRTFGQLGDGQLSPATSNVPVLAADGRKLSQMSVGRDNATCAIGAADSVVYCWGKGDAGQTGNARTYFISPGDSLVRPVHGALKARQVNLGAFHGCAIGIDGATWCWGSTQFYRPTEGTALGIGLPTVVAPAGRYVHVSAGYLQTCALDAAGVAWCWGEGVPSATGGLMATADAPRRIEGDARFVAIDAGSDGRGCGLTAAGGLWCWAYGASVPGYPQLTARAVMPTRTFAQLASEFMPRQCALATSGEVYCWWW